MFVFMAFEFCANIYNNALHLKRPETERIQARAVAVYCGVGMVFLAAIVVNVRGSCHPFVYDLNPFNRLPS